MKQSQQNMNWCQKQLKRGAEIQMTVNIFKKYTTL